MKITGLVLLMSLSAALPARAADGAPRYQIVFSPHGVRDTFLLDNVQGRVWVLSQNKDGLPSLHRLRVESDSDFQKRSDYLDKEALRRIVEEQAARDRRRFLEKHDVAQRKRDLFDAVAETASVSAARKIESLTKTQWYQYILLTKLTAADVGLSEAEAKYLETFHGLLKKTGKSDASYPAFESANAQFEKDFGGKDPGND